MAKQNTSNLLMIRPIAFGLNKQTVQDNHYQQLVEGLSNAKAQSQALKEFDDFVEKLRNAGVDVTVINDTLEPATPDSIFPNNWVSFHETGMVVLYPIARYSIILPTKATTCFLKVLGVWCSIGQTSSPTPVCHSVLTNIY